MLIDYHTLKAAFEKKDKKFSGKICKDTFCKVIHNFNNEYKDEDINRSKLVDLTTYEILYPEFLNLIYFNSKADMFILCVNCLKQILSQAQINNDIYNLIHHNHMVQTGIVRQVVKIGKK